MNRHDDELFDLRIADWLEGDPDLAPAQVMEIVGAALPSVAQRRRSLIPWQISPWMRLGLVAAVMVVGVVVAANLVAPFRPGIGGEPTPTPSPGPTAQPQVPTAGLETFTSGLYGYSIGYPSEWRVKAATRPLEPTEPPWAGSAPVDYFEQQRDLYGSPAGGPLGSLIAASVDIGPEGTLEDWTASTAIATCGEPSSRETIVVDGQSALMLVYSEGCYGLLHLWVTVVDGATGTHIVWLDDLGREAADRALFEDILATFSFPSDGQVSPTP